MLSAADPLGAMNASQDFHQAISDASRNSHLADSLRHCFDETARAHHLLPGLQHYMGAPPSLPSTRPSTPPSPRRMHGRRRKPCACTCAPSATPWPSSSPIPAAWRPERPAPQAPRRIHLPLRTRQDRVAARASMNPSPKATQIQATAETPGCSKSVTKNNIGR
ncbi:hypothetical protein DQ353_16680 [Arthrobacter sp. AQ5-05]|nr:hypothetical protein DQ353_16680 [Arthrobacter sp. AQ5-05]